MEKENEEKNKKDMFTNISLNTGTPQPEQNPNENINNTNNNYNNVQIKANKPYQKNEDQENNNILLTKSVINEIDKFSNYNYIPNKVDKSIKLPVNKNSKEYQKLKDQIISHIEDGIVELEYSNMDHAMEHVETSLYYLRNIRD